MEDGGEWDDDKAKFIAIKVMRRLEDVDIRPIKKVRYPDVLLSNNRP